VLRRQRVILGRLLRDVERKTPEGYVSTLTNWMERAWRIQRLQPHSSNKRYALHAPEVECIGQGKARQPFEFGVKVSMAVTHKSGLVVGARSFPGNPYDSHTLDGQIEQTTNLLLDLGLKPATAVVDLGDLGVDHLVPVNIIHRGRYKTTTDQRRRWVKRRQAIPCGGIAAPLRPLSECAGCLGTSALRSSGAGSDVTRPRPVDSMRSVPSGSDVREADYEGAVRDGPDTPSS
jgi:IS5 family transposase